MKACTSRSGGRIFFIEDSVLGAVEKWYTQDGHATFSKIEEARNPCPLDIGGMAIVDEPTYEFGSGDVRCSVFGRFLPDFCYVFSKKVSEKGKDKGFVFIKSWPVACLCVSLETAEKLLEELMRLRLEKRQEVDDFLRAWEERVRRKGISDSI